MLNVLLYMSSVRFVLFFAVTFVVTFTTTTAVLLTVTPIIGALDVGDFILTSNLFMKIVRFVYTSRTLEFSRSALVRFVSRNPVELIDRFCMSPVVKFITIVFTLPNRSVMFLSDMLRYCDTEPIIDMLSGMSMFPVFVMFISPNTPVSLLNTVAF